MRILVTGGAGYIGSVVTEQLLCAGHTAVVYDDLSTGHADEAEPGAAFVRADLFDDTALRDTLRRHRIETVMHFAGASIVSESVADPMKYYRQNVVGGLGLLAAMRATGVGALVFSSSAAVYGDPAKTLIDEEQPTVPINPYGETKLAFERVLGWHAAAWGLRAVSLRYFNAAGASTKHGERHAPETHLVPLVLEAAAGQRPHVTIYGDDYPTRDGTCVRDYVHVEDIASAHVLALAALGHGPGHVAYNLGTGEGATVREVVDAAARVTGRQIPVVVGQRRSGDPAILVAGSARIERELGWRPRPSALETIVESAWRRMNSFGSPTWLPV